MARVSAALDDLIENQRALRRSAEPVRCCSDKLGPAGDEIWRGVERREVRKDRKQHDGRCDGFDQPV